MMGNYRKPLKKLILFEAKFGFGNQLSVGKVLAPYNVCPKTVLFNQVCKIKVDFSNICCSPKIKQNKGIYKIIKMKNKIIFYYFGLTKIVPCSSLFSFEKSRIM